MIRWVNILLICTALPVFVSGQSLRCIYEDMALKYYQENDFLKAKAYSDSTLSECPELFDNDYVWHVRGYIMYKVFFKVDNRSIESSAREESLEAFYRSITLDSLKEEQVAESKRAINQIAITYWNDAANALRDTNSFDQAIDFFNKFKKAKQINSSNHDLSKYDIAFYKSLGNQYRTKYNNNKKLYKEYIDLAINSYKKVLEIDSMEYSANFNLGGVYHNLAVDIILNEIEQAEDLELFFMLEEKTIEYFNHALPYLKNAYLVQPQNKQVVHGMAAVYLSLHDDEKHLLYMNRLKELQELEKQKTNPTYSSWDSNYQYAIGDVVEYAGSFYKAVTDSIGVAPNSSSSDWEKIQE